jgi:hypothetical protein
MDTFLVLICLGALFLKHFIIDFPLQTPFQWKNKGKYGHVGGMFHAFNHGVGTILALALFTPLSLAITAGIIDSLVHYHIDWAKIRINHSFGLTPVNSPHFWTLLGFDQFLHALTYLVMVGYLA